MTAKFPIVLMLACAGAWAADIHPLDVKPGKWETTVNAQGSGFTIPPEALKQLPPEQRAKVQASIAAHMSKPTVNTDCMTKEKLQQAWNNGPEAIKECKSTVISSTSSKQDIHVECTTGRSKSSGNIKVESLDSEHVRGSIQMTAVTEDKSTMNLNYTFTSKWLGACTEK
ncbi:MAG TPA: DUF3617 family protein [Bryobacteraceae bacterium]|nr:DUF3617 family protein [Bryobacteraceae bacterium]